MTDNVAAEGVLSRLLAVKWDDDEAAFEHQSSRGRLTQEYLRRAALWARALGAEDGWPFFDIAAGVEPGVRADPALVEQLIGNSGYALGHPTVRLVAEGALHWAALGDLPRQRFADLDDPYEPMLVLFERGGGFITANGFVELDYGAVPIRTLAERVAQEAKPIDTVTLDELDAK